MRSAPKDRLMERDNSTYGSFAKETTSWFLGQINTPTKNLIEQDFCTSHERALPSDADTLNTKKLVIRFNNTGAMEYLEMSRSDVLRMVQVVASSGGLKDEKADVRRASLHQGSARALQSQRTRKRSSLAHPTMQSNVEIQPLHMRDLRKLDESFHAASAASITIRRQVVLVQAEPLRCVVMRNALLVFVPAGADTLIQILRDKMIQSCSEEAHIDFEFRAMEAIFHTLCKLLSGDCEKLVSTVSDVLVRLASATLSSGELEILNILKNKVHEFESQILDTRRVLMELLDNEQDMRLLYLTKLHRNPAPTVDAIGLDVEEAEGLIEAYLLDIHAMRTKVGLMQTRMVNTENIVMLKMDSVRNALLSIDTIFGLVMLAMNVSMFVSSAYGMNLWNGYETQPHMFWVVLFCSTLLTGVIILIGLRFFRAKGVILL
ncbi:Aste57867_18186 [Aphanomyces stellatus]|uniref:Magnesium transporter n=1 Tax=Aphanomyces stellatus TaxID=120398 RepID=A0A485LD52_9STRA|nr:hypothetical protein As57867_018124 [Aphanomyces stellatus]VFT94924.1 Aste57867_18186 [Aphanomyces stellatus]